MLEVTYYKDFRHNYVILKDVEAKENSYQCRMIAENKITGLLSCQQRHINGETLFYYDISSKQSLGSFCESDYVTMSFLERLLRQLQIIRENMADYLLTESCLLLKPEFVFMDVESGEFSFVYFPFEANENYMMSFMEYLTEKVDARDNEALDVCYKILQLMEREQFVLDEVLQWFEDDYTLTKESDESNGNGQIELDEWKDEELAEVPVREEKTAKIKEKTVLGVIGILFISAVLLFYVYRNYNLTQKTWIYFYVVTVACIILLISSILYLIYNKWKMDKETYKTGKTESEHLYKKIDSELYQETDAFEVYKGKEMAGCGNTVFIPWVENCENKLYGMGKGNKHHIDLGRLPLTVGKLAGSVDMVISDQSISRRHVRFSREENKICMTDLNSTNGTFKNGLRLEPNASEILEPGDEIRLGKLKFIYR